MDRSARFRRLAYLLNTVDLSPPGMPPSGILLVRHMEDPLPGQLAGQPHAVRANVEWERAARQALYEKYRRAVRPDRGYIPLNAEAVFFTDEAQMLAALALDISRGRAGARWWWRAAPGKPGASSTPAALLSLLSQKTAYLPAVLSYLARWGTAAAVVETLSIEQALELLAALGREYRPAKGASPVFQPEEITTRASPAAKADEGLTKAPWSRLLPSSWQPPLYMTRERAALMGIALCLFHAPSKLYAPSFLRRFKEWWRDRYRSPKEAALPPPGTSAGSGTGDHIEIEDASSPMIDTPLEEPPGKHENRQSPYAKPDTPGRGESRIRPGMEPGRPSNMAEDHPARPIEPMGNTTPVHPEVHEKEDTAAGIRFLDEKDGHTVKTGHPKYDSHVNNVNNENNVTNGKSNVPVKKVKTSGAAVEESEPAALAEDGVDTRLGGVFYLVNVIEQLDLLTAIEEECSSGPRPGPWAVLELLARALLGDQDQQDQDMQDDPLWPVLAQLDNREVETPPQADSRWLEPVLDRTRSFLGDVLGPPVPDRPEPWETMCFVPARLYVTATHVDIVMDMEHISMPVRTAGLDRDPGWMPQFARVIMFHFE
jgi:hypothetical protein